MDFMNNLLESFTDIDTVNIIWRKHALQRMLERSISRSEVKLAISRGTIIEEYPNDSPFPSCLVAFIQSDVPLHVVISYDNKEKSLYVITAYEPSTLHFNDDLITRKNNE